MGLELRRMGDTNVLVMFRTKDERERWIKENEVGEVERTKIEYGRLVRKYERCGEERRLGLEEDLRWYEGRLRELGVDL